MNRNSLGAIFLSIVILFLAGWSALAFFKDTAATKFGKAQTAFFDRPVALAHARASPIPHPLIVMLISDPWLMVVGSDSPAFALYSDGTAIFRTKSGMRSTKLDVNQRDELVRSLENPDLSVLAGFYEADPVSDQPTNQMLIYGRKTPFYISVYGSLDDKSVRTKLPKKITEAFDRLRHFQAPNAQTWLPDKVEVMVWPYEYAPERSIVWPQRWPHLNDPNTRKRGDSFSIFIPSAELPALKEFLASRTEKAAVEIDGKKFAASIRFPFPHETLWMPPATK